MRTWCCWNQRASYVALLVGLCLLASCVTKRYVHEQIAQVTEQQARAQAVAEGSFRELFARAYEQASAFTPPVICSVRYFDGSVACAVASYIVVNRAGWIITAAHIFDAGERYRAHAREFAVYKEQVRTIGSDPQLGALAREQRIAALATNPKWITDWALWWGVDGLSITDVHVLREADLAIGRLQPFAPMMVSQYPVFKNPATLRFGVSLCKLGFPFYTVSATFDPAQHHFVFAPGTLPIPRFPIEGMYTRMIDKGMSSDGKYRIKFLETSSPGLKGQSGGPIFDTKGTVWAMQSQTISLNLGFDVPNQYLNVGWGVHSEVLVAFLKANGVEFSISDY
jgi:hypothetical protein